MLRRDAVRSIRPGNNLPLASVTFNEKLVEIVNGDFEIVMKVIEIQKNVQDLVVILAVDPLVAAERPPQPRALSAPTAT